MGIFFFSDVTDEIPLDEIPLPGDIPDLEWKGKLFGVDSMYQWDDNKSYVQNVLEGNETLSALGTKIAPYVGPVAVAVGTAVAAYKTWEFFSGDRADQWKSKGITVPRQYGLNFYPPNPVDKDGDPLNLGSAPGLYFNFEQGAAIWYAAGAKATDTLGVYKEPLDEFIQRTGRRMIPTEPLIEATDVPSGESSGAGKAVQELMTNFAEYDEDYQQGILSPEFSSLDQQAEEIYALGRWNELDHFNTLISKPYEELNDKNKSRLDRLAVGLMLDFSVDDMIALDLTNEYFPDSMIVDDEGVLYFDQDFESGTFKRSHYVDTNMEELSERVNSEG